MPAEFRLPDVGEGIREAEVVRWLVTEGEFVREFDPIVEVQTDKAVVELPAPVSGRVAEILAVPGSVANVGDVLVTIDTETGVARGAQALIDSQSLTARTGAVTDHAAEIQSPMAVRALQAAQSVKVTGAAKGGTPAMAHATQPRRQSEGSRGRSGTEQKRSSGLPRPLATPGVRHLARELGVLLDEVEGSGANGRITRKDVQEYATQRATNQVGGVTASAVARVLPREETELLTTAGAHQPASTRIPFRGVRRATAEHVSRSAFTAPHVTTFDDCEATSLVALRNRWNVALEAQGKRLSYLPFIVKAVVSALRAFPYFNARLDEEAQEIELLAGYHIGLAVDTPDGLLVPVIRHADRLTVAEIGDEILRLTRGAKERKLSQQELRGSTFTITNMGPIGGMFATPIINYPEVGILAVHQIQRKPVVRGDDIVIRDMLTLSLSFDHRIIDGAGSVRFMNHIRRLIEHPELLMLELK
ncbi:dihydrolipoamide acetyltransferase family protein [Alicyclobacillus sp. ALC3]|uniref:dihydrolipoamide acetyltransferase family protein n=1 Tax=Alicyclobacillus sp. ALC3 TaxID=2796143 RepID=UPI002378DDC0|nr:dihydrolipoamide acetyltransferase family protein [Alicyclobacillus sp. ALC3]WDL95572.1 2-oxo acid dehydrogenase subunit E2 [Alicyclobacillus sp. ALC3]